MGQDLFKNLPSEIILDIPSRLHARDVMRCKCVCTPWLGLLSTPEFVKSHLSKSVPGLVVIEMKSSKPFKIVEYLDELDPKCDWHRLNIVFNLDLPFREPMHSSADGLIFLRGFYKLSVFILCSPLTREYIKLPCPPQPSSQPWRDAYGFGVSRMSSQYKVVRIFTKRLLRGCYKIDQYECQVYTVGTGSWRSIANVTGSTIGYQWPSDRVAFLRGNLHWWAGKAAPISCFDLETELFSTFSNPPSYDSNKSRTLSVLRDCLCACDNSFIDGISARYEIDIWVMKEYGDEKSWTKEFIIRTHVNMGDCLENIFPIKVFKDGDILIDGSNGKPLYYSSKTKTIQEVEVGCYLRIYTPSFLPLKTFAMENVRSF